MLSIPDGHGYGAPPSREEEAGRGEVALADHQTPLSHGELPLLAQLSSETALADQEAEGERRLLLAILEDAIHCYQTCLLARDVTRKRLFQEAELWLMRGIRLDASKEPFISFHYVCDVLGIEPAYIRRCLNNWRQAHLEPRPRRHVA